MKNLTSFILLIATAIIETVFLLYIRKRVEKENTSLKYFICLVFCMIMWCIILDIQIFIIDFISPSKAIYSDYIVYIFVVLMPVFLLLFAYSELTGKTRIERWQLSLFILSFFNLIMIWTNDFHHLFYVRYSTEFSNTVFGPFYTYAYCLYIYGLTAIGIIMILISSIKKSSIKSKQTFFILISAIVPISVNVLASTRVIPANIYETPVSFSVTVLTLGFAMFRYNFLNISPVATTRIVNQMSDAYIVLNVDYKILDCNSSFEKFFNVNKNEISGKYFKDINLGELVILHDKPLGNYLKKAQNDNKVYKINAKLKDESKYFNIEISRIISDYRCVGILVLIKDATQHILDMKALKQNQEMLIERERLATLGQMVGGIAHNLKTPIMSIAGAMEGLEDLIREYDESIDDPDVTKEDHHAIAKDMSNWVAKVNSYDSYMSDVITAVKGQAVNFNEVSNDKFTVGELLKTVNILMKHELKNALVTLNINCAVPESTTIKGNVNSLVQIVNNLISNAIQAYIEPDEEQKDNKEDITEKDNNEDIAKRKIIDLNVTKEKGNIVISVRDYGCGIPPKVQEKLFKSMVTTKGHNGTGLGLFMSYSNIRGHFNGDLKFTSEVGKGTTFYIIIPIDGANKDS